ncbi:hypothetical protein GCM10009853_026380 [Glycomyces scopariae]
MHDTSRSALADLESRSAHAWVAGAVAADHSAADRTAGRERTAGAHPEGRLHLWVRAPGRNASLGHLKRS